MAEETFMVLRVDLGCTRCYKKVKKLLCRYSEIRDQVFYEKEDTVMIKVVCCNPERIRSKLICKSDGAIKSIEIRKPEKPKPPPAPEKPKDPEKPKPPPEKPKDAEKPKPPPEKPKEAEKPKPPPEKPKEAEKPKPPPEKPKEAEKPKPPPEKPKEAEKPKPPPEKPKEAEKPSKPADPPKDNKPADKPPPQEAPAPTPVAGYPQLFPVAVCCKPCYDMGHGGPCQHGYGVPYQPPPPPSSYDGYVRLLPSYGEPSYGGWSSGCRCNRSYGCRCHCEYFTEENPSCTIM